MKKFTLIIVTILINILVTFGLLYFFVLSKNIYIEPGVQVNKDLILSKGSIVLDERSTVTGKIFLEEGDIILKDKATIHGDIQVEQGNIQIGKEVNIQGNLSISEGNLTLGENVTIHGNIQLKTGDMQKHSTAQISGEKPALFITYDWPDALAYFDVLPQQHKEAVGFIFLTKDKNTIIRNDDVKKATDYFDGIYYYKDHQLFSIDVANNIEAKPFFEKARTFFSDLPERRLGPFGVGATTKKYAHNGKKADIYVPAEGSRYTFIHEMGHVLDFKNDFSDFHEPTYPFISQKMALNSYAATHPGEDFAEAYKYYVLDPQYFSQLIEEEPQRQEKYDFLKQYVFENKEFS